MKVELAAIVGSSKLSGWAWEPWHKGDDKGTLTLQFTDGAIWHYSDVPRHVLEAMLLAPSKGAYFEKRIKPHFAAMPAMGDFQTVLDKTFARS